MSDFTAVLMCLSCLRSEAENGSSQSLVCQMTDAPAVDTAGAKTYEQGQNSLVYYAKSARLLGSRSSKRLFVNCFAILH